MYCNFVKYALVISSRTAKFSLLSFNLIDDSHVHFNGNDSLRSEEIYLTVINT